MALHLKYPLVKLGFQGTPAIMKHTLSLTRKLSKLLYFALKMSFHSFTKIAKPKSNTIFLVIMC
jgi:hypothetical protein